jgi:hypothetical protein
MRETLEEACARVRDLSLYTLINVPHISQVHIFYRAELIDLEVKRIIDANGGVGVEFNTIAIDDGIAMGHDGMLYSLPSRELIADSVEYMVNAHKADALICISNCDKITPGMQIAALRLNIPTIFVSGGPMEAGRTQLSSGEGEVKLDLIDSMIAAGDTSVPDAELERIEAVFNVLQESDVDGESGGMGLGLSLARRILRLHGGDVVARRGPDDELVISVTVPLDGAGDEG